MKLKGKQYFVLMIVCLCISAAISMVNTIITKNDGVGSFIALAPAMLGWFTTIKDRG